MSSRRLTDSMLSNLKPRAAQYEVVDRNEPTLTVRIGKSGRKSLYFLGRHPRSRKTIRRLIGAWPGTSLDEARDVARDWRKRIRSGDEPRLVFGIAESTEPVRLSDGFDEYETKRLALTSKASALERMRCLRKDFAPLLDIPMRSIERRHIFAILDKLVARGTPSAANHAFANVRAFFNWALDRGYCEASPCDRMKRPAPATKRQRVLLQHEIPKVWAAVEKLGYPYAPIVRLMLLSGQRRGEVAAMRWMDLNVDDCTWIVPRQLTKSDRTHLVPLTPTMLEIIRELPQLHDTWVFPARTGGRQVSGWSKWKAELSQLVPEIEDWVLHDLRRTVYSGLGRLRVPPDTKERIVNHAQSRLVETYDVYAYLDEKAEALAKWDAWIRQVVFASNAPVATPERSLSASESNGRRVI